jgi:hypothetical protein
MAKRLLPSLPDLKKLIGLNYDRFVAAIERVQPLVYKVLISQTGTAAPTVKVLENTLGAAVLWARTSAGLYTGTLADAFTADKTALIMQQPTALNRAAIARTSANVVTITTSTLSEVSNVLTATATDALLTDIYLEIVVYP